MITADTGTHDGAGGKVGACRMTSIGILGAAGVVAGRYCGRLVRREVGEVFGVRAHRRCSEQCP